MYNEKLRAEILFSGASRICSNRTRKLRRRSRHNRAAGIVSLGYRAPPKNEGSDPGVWLKLKPTIARARSFHSFLSFVRSFVRSQRKYTSLNRFAGLQGVLGRCVNVRIMRHRYPRPAKCAIFSIQEIRDRYDLTDDEF